MQHFGEDLEELELSRVPTENTNSSKQFGSFLELTLTHSDFTSRCLA